MNVEHYFLRYAFPCAYIVKNLGEIDEDEFEFLKDCAINLKPISKDRLEKIFYRAFEKISKYTKEYWDIVVMEKYFKEWHNQEIDKGVGYYATAPAHIKKLSKVYKAKILDKKFNTFLVEYPEGQRRVFDDFVKDAQVGDFVFIHFGYAVEMASEK
jgi:hydrogenase maturation factor